MIPNLQHTISQGEGLTIEFKKANKQLPENLFETVCAFLNRNGGTILLGVDDNGAVLGIEEDTANALCKQIANLSNNPQKLFPSFLLDPQIHKHNNKIIISIYIPIGSQVHKCKNKIYDRSADGDFELKTDEQLKNIYNRKNSLYSENTIYPYLEETDFAEGVVERTRRIIRINRPNHPWNELSVMDFYKTAGLYRKDLFTGKEGFTMSALLLFGKDEIIQSAIPHYKVDALLRKENIDRYDDRENIKCNLIEAYDRLMAFVTKHLPDKFYLEGDQRVSLREKIFREIAANILIHREYSNAFPSSFIIYTNRVETKNANKPHLIQQLTPGNFEPYPKNPHIAQMFTQMGRSEELGTGVQNVYKYSKAYSGSEKISFKEEDVFITIVPLNKTFRNVTDNVTDDVTDNVTDKRLVLIVNLIHDDNSISTAEIASKLKVTKRTVLRDMEKLKKQNMLKRIGREKSGYWKIMN